MCGKEWEVRTELSNSLHSFSQNMRWTKRTAGFNQTVSQRLPLHRQIRAMKPPSYGQSYQSENKQLQSNSEEAGASQGQVSWGTSQGKNTEQSLPKIKGKSGGIKFSLYLNGLTWTCLLKRAGNNTYLLFFSPTLAKNGMCNKSHSGIVTLFHLFSWAESLPGGPWLGKGGLPKERSNYSSWDVLSATHCSEVGPPRRQWEKHWVNTN